MGKPSLYYLKMFNRKGEARKYAKRLKEAGRIKGYRVIKQGRFYMMYKYE